MGSIVSEYLRQIREKQRACRKANDAKGAIAAYYTLVSELLEKIEKMDDSDRASLSRSMTTEDTGLLFGAAQSAAERAVREHNPALLGIGVRALLAEDCKDDYRETLMMLTLLCNSARKLATSLEETYLRWRTLAREETQKIFDDYFFSGGSTLDAMGFIEATNERGEFAYKRTW